MAASYTTIRDTTGKPKAETDKSPLQIEQLAFISDQERDTAIALAEDLATKGATLPSKEKLRADILRKSDTAADIAMFGRMLADSPEYNREAAVQVAHAISTHAVTVEDDYYTAVDDLKRPSEDAGAGFLGEAGFGSGIFYLYACVDRSLLARNLGGDEALAGSACAALIEAAATVAPTGKQASFAARARASYALVEQGDVQPRTLAAAFARSVTSDDVIATSIANLRKLRSEMDSAYGPCAQEIREMDLSGQSGAGARPLADLIAFSRG